MRLPEPVLGTDHPANLLRELHAAVEGLRDRPDCSARLRVLLAFLLAALDRYDQQAATGLTLDAAMGLGGRSGPARWWNRERIANRDRALRAIWRRFYPDLDGTQAAAAILRDLAHLERQARPSPGTPTGELMLAMRHAAIPGSSRALRDTLLSEI